MFFDPEPESSVNDRLQLASAPSTGWPPVTMWTKVSFVSYRDIAFVCPILLGQVEIRQNGQMALAAMVETTKSQSTKIVYEVGDRPPCSKSKMSSPSCSLPATGAASFPSSAFPARALCPARNSPRGPYAAATTLLSPSLPFGHFPSGFNQTP